MSDRACMHVEPGAQAGIIAPGLPPALAGERAIDGEDEGLERRVSCIHNP
jgi:hypothetical protein